MSRQNEEHLYIAIDLKSFYASVECLERGLDPLNTNLVVADHSRTEKTICLAVTPTLKSVGVSGRARLFEVVAKVKEANEERKRKAPNQMFKGASFLDSELRTHPELELDYICAPPQMAKYMEYSTKIYHIYLNYVAPEDIHVYSVDEVFLDVTQYLKTANMTAKEYASKIIREVSSTMGITATAGIGTNLYLCKVAMDIVAKHIPADEHGVRIAELDELKYRQLLWNHQPLTDFWRVGRGYAKKLAEYGMFTMGDIARCSLGNSSDWKNQDLLFRLFGINAELLIDHAWGYEPCTMEDVKAYKPEQHSISSGQVLQYPYTFEKARVIVKEMTELLALDLVSKGFVTNQIVLTVGYDIENLQNPALRKLYKGPVTVDMYGREVPKHAHGTANLKFETSSTKLIMDAVLELYDKILSPYLLVRRVNLTANKVIESQESNVKVQYEQLDLFTNIQEDHKKKEEQEHSLQKEKQMQMALLKIKNKYGKNAILKGTNFEDGATTKDRNNQIGGHKA